MPERILSKVWKLSDLAFCLMMLGLTVNWVFSPEPAKYFSKKVLIQKRKNCNTASTVILHKERQTIKSHVYKSELCTKNLTQLVNVKSKAKGVCCNSSKLTCRFRKLMHHRDSFQICVCYVHLIFHVLSSDSTLRRPEI